MCGIVGIFSFNKLSEKAEQIRRESSLFMFTELMELTSARGEDATGVTTLFENGDYMIQKMGIPSPEFISRYGNKASDFEGYLNLCRKNESNFKALIGHCRKSSVGNTTDNENNHPIKAGEIVGIHNGTLKNHNKIFTKLGCARDGVVDSEAIFRLIQHFTDNCKEPFTLDILEETVRRLEGSYSCITYNANNPYQIGIFRDLRPMELILIRPLNIVVIVSEKKFIEKVIYNFNKFTKLYKTNAPLIRKDDVEYASFLNQCVGILNLTAKIGKDTQIADLMVKKDTFKTTNIWHLPVTTYYGNNINRSNPPATTNATLNTTTKPVIKDSKKENSVKSNKPVGKVYCKTLQKYVDKDVAEAEEIEDAVVVDISSGKVNKLNEVVDDFKKEKKEENVVEKKSIVTEPEKLAKEKKEVDVSTDPEIIAGSQNSRESLLKYTSNEDLAKDIDAASASTVKVIEAFALANRVRKHVYETAFIDGAKFYEDKKAKSNNDKIVSMQSTIRVAKKVIRILALNSELILHKDSTEFERTANIEYCLKEERSDEVTFKNVQNLITKGDCLDCPTLGILTKVLGDEVNEKESTVSKV